MGAVVAREQWWLRERWLLLGAVVANPAISPAFSGLPILHCRLSSEGWQRRINTKRSLWSTKNNKGNMYIYIYKLIKFYKK
jgi:hypothetical protein